MAPKKPAGRVDLSLVICTYGRTKQLAEVIQSIRCQSVAPKEIIIVDQNPPGFLDNLLEDCAGKLNIVHKRVSFTGASKARNFGASIATSDLIAFPDDDCTYREDTIKNVIRAFERDDELGVLIAGKDEILNATPKVNQAENAMIEIHTILDLFRAKAETSNIFARKKVLSKLEYIFDVNIGPGEVTEWASNEETDLLVRLLQKNVLIAKDETIRIIHHSCQGSLKKTLQYGMGRYELIKRNNLGIFIYFINLLQPIARLILKPRLKYIPTCFMTIIGRSGLINTLISVWKTKNLARTR
ncbi:glycosyltransferase family 2 protein [Synechococcus sp. N19]|uniref:glycosyltransferase family 2 protein n=1 Tax=Synechococcus sp. N19 TaxID=2575512 RepID=UPI000E0FCD77|nr:glycosyltransferase family 2 protein [Synechococcus sp. N19]